MARHYDLTLEKADCPPWDGPPRQSLLICTLLRSGSTLLGEAVHFAGGLGCPLEYFHRGFRPGFEERWKTNGLEAYAAAVHRHRTAPSGVFSVKLFWHDMMDMLRESAPGAFDRLLGAAPERLSAEDHRKILDTLRPYFPNPSVVYLTRRDELRQAISNFIASRTRNWRKFSTPRRAGESGEIEFSFDEIFQLYAAKQRSNKLWTDFFAANALSIHRIFYEDLDADYEGTLRALFSAIGRPDAPIPPPRLRKQADARSDALVEQFLAEFRRRAGVTAPAQRSGTPSN